MQEIYGGTRLGKMTGNEAGVGKEAVRPVQVTPVKGEREGRTV